MAKQKKPRFFCDGCGHEVAANAGRCPCCGKYFASIRCPKCHWTGDQAAFSNGCPKCGYSSSAGEKTASKNPISYPKKGAAETVPSWFFATAISFLVLILALLFFYVIR
ncbi:MAG: hypothetical protein LBV52_02165 [Spirochaetaceae bacterium]|nr:hypothetical protein [Spirochaetaceae bacterium]